MHFTRMYRTHITASLLAATVMGCIAGGPDAPSDIAVVQPLVTDTGVISNLTIQALLIVTDARNSTLTIANDVLTFTPSAAMASRLRQPIDPVRIPPITVDQGGVVGNATIHITRASVDLARATVTLSGSEIVIDAAMSARFHVYNWAVEPDIDVLRARLHAVIGWDPSARRLFLTDATTLTFSTPPTVSGCGAFGWCDGLVNDSIRAISSQLGSELVRVGNPEFAKPYITDGFVAVLEAYKNNPPVGGPVNPPFLVDRSTITIASDQLTFSVRRAICGDNTCDPHPYENGTLCASDCRPNWQSPPANTSGATGKALWGEVLRDYVIDSNGDYRTTGADLASLTVPVATAASMTYADVTGDQVDELCFIAASGIQCLTVGAASRFGSSNPMIVPGLSTADLQTITADATKWRTLRFVDVSGDGKADACIRRADGIHCAVMNAVGTAFGPMTRWDAMFSDGNGFTDPQYGLTIGFPDLDRDGKADLCARGALGIYCGISNGAGFSLPTLRGGAFGNADGWSAEDRWSTLQYVRLAPYGLWACGRVPSGSLGGIACAGYDGSVGRFGALVRWSEHFTDAEGGNDPSVYRTIQFADIDGDNALDLCGRRAGGFHCSRSGLLQPRFAGFYGERNVVPLMSDANFWNQSKFAETIRVVDVDGDGKADVCGRGINGIYCATSTSVPRTNYSSGTMSFAALVLWTDWFGDDDLARPMALFPSSTGFGSDERFWRSVRPARVRPRTSGGRNYDFCGFSFYGIWCGNR